MKIKMSELKQVVRSSVRESLQEAKQNQRTNQLLREAASKGVENLSEEELNELFGAVKSLWQGAKAGAVQAKLGAAGLATRGSLAATDAVKNIGTNLKNSAAYKAVEAEVGNIQKAVASGRLPELEAELAKLTALVARLKAQAGQAPAAATTESLRSRRR